MANYLLSTHAENWIFDTNKLYEFKKHALEENKLFQEDINNLIELEYSTTIHFCKQILIIFGLTPGSKAIIKRKWKVPATAISFFHRFYVRNTMIDHDPRLIMLACIFLAGKTEESFVHLQDLYRITDKYSSAKISSAEAVLIEGLNFDLLVYHPLLISQSILGDLKLWKQKQKVPEEEYKEFSQIVSKWLTLSDNTIWIFMTTNIHLKYPPLSIALAALFLVAPSPEVKSNLESYFISQFGENNWSNLKVSFLKVTFSSSLTSILSPNQEIQIKLENDPIQADSNLEKVKLYLEKLKSINKWHLTTQEIVKEIKEEIHVKNESQMDIV